MQFNIVIVTHSQISLTKLAAMYRIPYQVIQIPLKNVINHTVILEKSDYIERNNFRLKEACRLLRITRQK